MTRPRAALTLIEMGAVISIMVLLAALAAPKAVSAVARAGLNQSVAAVMETAQVARTFALRSDPPIAGTPYACYGVILIDGADGAAPQVAVTFGTNSPPIASDILWQKEKRDFGDGAERLWRTWSEYQVSSNLVDAQGRPQPVHARRIPPHLRFHRPVSGTPLGEQPVSGSWGWILQHRSGYIIALNAPGAAMVDVGMDPALILRDAQSTLAARLYLFSIGANHVETLR